MTGAFLSIGIAVGILFESLIAGIVVLVFLSNWGGVPGLGFTLLFSGVGFKSCLGAARVRPSLWILWGVLFGAVPLLVMADFLSGAAVPFRVILGETAVLAAGFSGSYFGMRSSLPLVR